MKFSRLLLVSVVFQAIPLGTFAGDYDSAVTSDQVTAESNMAMPQIWSFENCIDWAINNNTSIRRAMLNVLQADQDISSAKDLWLPTVGFNTQQTYSVRTFSENGHKNTYNSTYDISANWTVWEGNVRNYRLQTSKLLKRQQELSTEDAAVTIKLGILQSYLNILYAREAITIAEQTLEVSTVQTKRARRLMEAGRTSKVDYAQIETQKAKDAYSLVEARNNYETSVMSLKKLLQLGLEYDFEIADANFPDEDVMSILPDRLSVYETAMSWLPEIRSNELNKEIYANDVKIAKAGLLPTVTLNGGVGSGYESGGDGWGTQMKNNFNPYMRLGISIPIFDGNSTKRAVAKARLSELEYDLEKKSLLDDLSQTIENLYIEADNARAKYTSGIAQLNSAQLTSDLTNRQFELGFVNTLDLLTAHNSLLNARLELLLSKYMAILANKTITFYATQSVTL